MSDSRPLGHLILDLARQARNELVLCAPFVKLPVVTRILQQLDPSVDVAVFTRWRPEEVAAGVSDPGVLEPITDAGGRVYLHDRLHAKFYRADSRIVYGSANLTSTALGWSMPSNVEVLLDGPSSFGRDLEALLLRESVPATPELAYAVETAASAFALPAQLALKVEEPCPRTSWLPTLRIPADLFIAYCGELSTMTTVSGHRAQADLAFLEIPPGLNRVQFNSVVASRLLQAPAVVAVDNFLRTPKRFGAVRQYLQDRYGLDREIAAETWQTLMRWFLEFLPRRYTHETAPHSEIVGRVGNGVDL